MNKTFNILKNKYFTDNSLNKISKEFILSYKLNRYKNTYAIEHFMFKTNIAERICERYGFTLHTPNSDYTYIDTYLDIY